MKKNIFIIFFIFTYSMSFGQDFSALAKAEFKSVESYKAAENQVLSSANYLFDNPTDQAELNRLNAVKYIMKWMGGTPDYTFDLGQKAMDLTNSNTDLLGLYMAAMTKAVLENTTGKLSSEEIYSKAEKIMLNYCANANNKIKTSRKIKQLIKEMQ